MAADDHGSQCQGHLVNHTGGKQIVVQSGTALAEQAGQPSACELINDQGQVEDAAFRLLHCNARRSQRFKIIRRLARRGNDHDRATLTFGRCRDRWIKVCAGRNDHQGWIGSQTLLVANLKLPRLKINGPVALKAHSVGSDQDRVGQGALQGKQVLITGSIEGARSAVGALH